MWLWKVGTALSIHSTAIIDPKAEIDPSVEIGPYCVIDAHVRIAAGCKLWQNVSVTGWTQIDADCELHPGVVVGHAPQDIKYAGQRTFCRIGRRTILREYVTIHRGTIPESETRIGNDCFLLAASHVGHNSVVGDRVTLINQVMLGGHVRVGHGAIIGGGAGLHQFVRIGDLAMVSGHAAIKKDIVPYSLVDRDGCIRGPNRVGIRRADIPEEHAQEIRLVFRELFKRGSNLQDTVERISELVTTPEGRAILDFLKEPSQRGLAGRAGSGRTDTSADEVDA